MYTIIKEWHTTHGKKYLTQTVTIAIFQTKNKNFLFLKAITILSTTSLAMARLATIVLQNAVGNSNYATEKSKLLQFITI